MKLTLKVGEQEVNLDEFVWPRLLSTVSMILLVIGVTAFYLR